MLIDQTAIHLAACKNPAYRSRVWVRFEALLSFLRDQGWIDDSVIDRYAGDRENFELHAADLTQDGLDFTMANYDKWLRKVDRGENTKSAEELYSLLKKFIET
jgi:hypothetical protein